MKRMIVLCVTALCLAAVSCQKDSQPVADEGEIRFNITVAAPGGPGTKAAKKGWVAGDKLNIWFDGNGADQTVPDLIMAFDGTQWKALTLRSGVSDALKTSGKMAAVYEGYNDIGPTKYTYGWHLDYEWFYPPFESNSFTTYDRAYSTPLVAYTFKQDYSYDGTTVTAALSGWKFYTMFKVLITGLSAAAQDCFIQVKDEDGTYAKAAGPLLILPATDGTGISTTASTNYNGYACGVQEADGVAFYYKSFQVTNKKVTFRLTTDGGTTEKSYTTPSITLDASDTGKCVGVSIAYSKFD